MIVESWFNILEFRFTGNLCLSKLCSKIFFKRGKKQFVMVDWRFLHISGKGPLPLHSCAHQGFLTDQIVLNGSSFQLFFIIFTPQPVIAATSLGVKSPLLSHKWFDYCIIDEASQISQPVCLAPLFKTSKFVLVGDHKQLPPLVQSTTARYSQNLMLLILYYLTQIIYYSYLNHLLQQLRCL